MEILSNSEFCRNARGNVSRALRFVASRIGISLHVGKCLRTADIFGRENVSTVRRGRRSRVVKERADGQRERFAKMQISCRNSQTFSFRLRHVTHTANNQRLPCAYARLQYYLSQRKVHRSK